MRKRDVKENVENKKKGQRNKTKREVKNVKKNKKSSQRPLLKKKKEKKLAL